MHTKNNTAIEAVPTVAAATAATTLVVPAFIAHTQYWEIQYKIFIKPD